MLFRVEPSRSGQPVVLVQTRDNPDWSGLPRCYLLGPAESKRCDLAFAPGQRLCFRLRANPTKKVGSVSKEDRLAGKKGNGQRLALLREDEQVAWLLEKAEQGGFRIPGEWLQDGDGGKAPNFRCDVMPEGWVRCGKDGHTAGRFHAVRFEGMLEVTDPGRFLLTLQNGIGSAKGFGFGLLSIAPARTTS